MHYTKTALEEWIANKYIEEQIYNPQDIDVYCIAKHYGIYVHLKSIPARFDICGDYKAIVLDNRSTHEEQNEQFFHELCHILRHAGHQTIMPNAFRELQERDAKHFTMYASIPYFMLDNYDLENPNIVYELSCEFKVTEKLCLERLKHIKRNNFAYRLHRHVIGKAP